MFDEKANITFGTADLWRAAQQSRSAYLGVWLGSLFRRLRIHGLRKLEQGALTGVIPAFPPPKLEVAASITDLPSSQVRMAATRY